MFVILNLILLLVFIYAFFFFFKQKTAYEMRISDWSSDVCSSDLLSLAGTRDTIRLLSWLRTNAPGAKAIVVVNRIVNTITPEVSRKDFEASIEHGIDFAIPYDFKVAVAAAKNGKCLADAAVRSEEHTSELQSLMRISYAVFCLKKKKQRLDNKEPHVTK